MENHHKACLPQDGDRRANIAQKTWLCPRPVSVQFAPIPQLGKAENEPITMPAFSLWDRWYTCLSSNRHCLLQIKRNMHTTEINEALEKTMHSNILHFQQVWQRNKTEKWCLVSTHWSTDTQRCRRVLLLYDLSFESVTVITAVWALRSMPALTVSRHKILFNSMNEVLTSNSGGQLVWCLSKTKKLHIKTEND